MTQHRLEVADVIRSCGPTFLDQFGDSLSSEQRRVLDDLARCRTAALGGHVEACDQCGHQQIAYNSCRNRHCPKCQGTAAAQWLDASVGVAARRVFPRGLHAPGDDRPHRSAKSAGGLRDSLPSRRGDLVTNRRRSQAPRCRDRYLGRPAHVGTESTASSSRPLCRPRWRIVAGWLALDCMPSGVLSASARSQLRLPRQILALLRNAFDRGRLSFHGKLSELSDPCQFQQRLTASVQTDWVVYAKPPFGGPAKC